jgi:hypothetical protein
MEALARLHRNEFWYTSRASWTRGGLDLDSRLARFRAIIDWICLIGDAAESNPTPSRQGSRPNIACSLVSPTPNLQLEDVEATKVNCH